MEIHRLRPPAGASPNTRSSQRIVLFSNVMDFFSISAARSVFSSAVRSFHALSSAALAAVRSRPPARTVMPARSKATIGEKMIRMVGLAGLGFPRILFARLARFQQRLQIGRLGEHRQPALRHMVEATGVHTSRSQALLGNALGSEVALRTAGVSAGGAHRLPTRGHPAHREVQLRPTGTFPSRAWERGEFTLRPIARPSIAHSGLPKPRRSRVRCNP